MPEKKDTIVARLALERDYLTQEQLDDALETQRKARDEMGMDMPLLQVLQNKHLLTPDQMQEIRNAAAVESGEARLVAGYEVVSKLGQGGMGAVYKAKSQTTGQFVALKVLPPSLATPDLVKRFEREAAVVSQLDHDHIVGCVEFGYDKRRKVHFCALELIEGEDLDRRISALGTIPEREAIRITLQVAEALQHAFFNGLVHRDIKPANIMVASDGTAKLLDLGLAREANTEVTRLTQTGAFVGSPYYASPEQATGGRDIDIRSDIYSLGCTLYHMVTGKPPFSGTTVLQVLQKHLTERMPWPQEINPDLTEGICRIIAKMMAKSPADRYQDPNELLADIDTHLEGGEPDVGEEALKGSSVNVPVLVRKRLRERRRAARPLRRSGGVRSVPRGRRATDDKAPDRKPLSVGIMAGIAAVAVIVLGMGVAMLGGKKTPPERPPASSSSRQASPVRKADDGAAREANKRAAAYQRTAAEALRKARVFEEQNPHLRSQVIRNYEDVVRRFPATPATKEAMKRLRDLAKAGPRRETPLEPVAGATRGGAARSPDIPADAVEFGGHFYKLLKVTSEKMTWHDAKRFCEERGGHLVTITSPEEHAFVAGMLRHAKMKAAWIGLTEEGHRGNWRWVTGKPLTYEGWAKNEPNNWKNFGEHWGTMCLRDSQYGWSDNVAGNPRYGDKVVWYSHGFVCEWDTGAAKPSSSTPPAPRRTEVGGLSGESAALKSAPPPPMPDVYLSDLKPLKSVAGWGGSPKMDRSIQDKPLTVNGKTFDKGIGTHAHSEIVFALDPGWRRFVASAGCDDESKGSVAFEVHADAVLLARSTAMGPRQLWHFDLAVPQRSRELRLVVTDGGNGASHDHADWLNAGFVTGARPTPPAGAKAPAGADLARGLTAWCKFDEPPGSTRAEDSSGSDNHGSPVVRAQSGAEGKIGGAWKFEGKSYVAVPDAVINPPEGTICGWVNVARHGGEQHLFGTDNRARYYVLRTRGGRLRGYIVSGALDSPQTIPPGEWHHWAVTWVSNERIALYIDGVEVASSDKMGATSPPARSNIGSYDRQASYLNGLVDDVRVYNRALPAEEIRALYELPQNPGAAEGKAADTGLALDDFDALVAKGDYAGARKWAEGAAAKAEGELKAMLLASAGVANALQEREKAVRRGAEALVGKDVKLATTDRAESGRASGVTDAGVVLKIKKTMRGMGTVETSITVKWADLAFDEEATLARKGGWKAESSDDHVALALLARARNDEGSVLAALRAAGDHPLAAHLREKMEAARREEAARSAWSGIRAKARMKKPSSTKSRALLESIKEFKRKHGATEFAASIADELAKLKLRAWVLGRPGLLGTYFKDMAFNEPVLRRVDPQVDFKWGENSPAHGVPKDNFSVRWEGLIVPPTTGDYIFYLTYDDRARLWIAGQLMLMVSGQATELRSSKPSGLRAGKALPVKLEHEEVFGVARMGFLWTGPGIPEPVPVPTECLRPPMDYEDLPGPPITE